MNSLILKTTSRFLITLLLLYSVFLLLRGHNHPGGGFVGGLVATNAWALYGIAFGAPSVRNGIIVSPLSIAGFGFLIALGSGMLSFLYGSPFLTGHWYTVEFSEGRKFSIGTPVLFDIGVFLIVLGSALEIILNLEAKG
jgi:multicomponent Na+:H+ antiporter subunit B